MNLQNKTLVFFLILLVCMSAVVTIISNSLITREFSEIEGLEVLHENEKIELIIRSQISALERTNIDWAYWDDTYNFMMDKNEEYLQSNLQDDTFMTLRLNYMIFINNSNEIVYAKSFDLDKNEEIQVSNELIGIVRELDKLGNNANSPDVKGLIVLPDGPAFITSKQILKSTRLGPPRGKLIFVRGISDYELNTLAEINKYPVYILSQNDLVKDPNFSKILDYPLSKNQSFVVPMDHNLISGYKVLDDIYGHPTIILRVDTNRDIYNIGIASIWYILVVSILISIIFVIAFFIFVHKEVLLRLLELNREVNVITSTLETSKRLDIKGNDEISLLANNVNLMIDSIEESQHKLRNIIEHSTNIFYSHTTDNVFTYVSPQVKDIFGIEPEEALIDWTSFLTDNPVNQKGIEYTRKAIETGKKQPPYELEVINKKGKKIWVEVYETPIVQNGKTVEIVGAIVDITKRKKALIQINKNIEYFAHLVDHIRNPLAILSGVIYVNIKEEKTSTRLMKQVEKIEEIISKLDQGWMDSEDTRNFLKRNFDFEE